MCNKCVTEACRFRHSSRRDGVHETRRLRRAGLVSRLELTRAELVERLAEVSHRTWMRQKARDQGVPLEELGTEVTDHDRERAEEAVRELERLGLWPPARRAGEP